MEVVLGIAVVIGIGVVVFVAVVAGASLCDADEVERDRDYYRNWTYSLLAQHEGWYFDADADEWVPPCDEDDCEDDE